LHNWVDGSKFQLKFKTGVHSDDKQVQMYCRSVTEAHKVTSNDVACTRWASGQPADATAYVTASSDDATAAILKALRHQKI